MTPRVWALLVLVIVLGAGFRFCNLGGKSLWSDEIATIASSLGNSIDPVAYEVRGESYDPMRPVPARWYRATVTTSHGLFNFAQTTAVLRYNIHPPFFFWLMNGYIHAFGYDTATLRIPAVLFGILCIPMIFILGRRLGGNGLGLLAAAVLSVSGYQVSHAQDARQYTMLTLLAMASVWWMLRLLERPDAGRWYHWLLLTLMSAVGIYSQYLYGLFLVFLYGYAGWQKRRDAAFLKRLGLSALGVGVLFVPWLPVFKYQMAFFKEGGHYTQGLWNPVQLPEKLWRTLNEFVMPETWGKVLPLLIFGIPLITWFRQGERRTPVSPVVQIMLLWILCVVGGQVGVDLLKDTSTATIRRYTLLAAPAYYLLLSWALLQLRQVLPGTRLQLRALMIPLMLGLSLFYTGLILEGVKGRSDDFMQAAARLNTRVNPACDVVLVNRSGAMAAGLAFYLRPDISMLGLHARIPADFQSKAMQARLRNVLADQPQNIWTVYSHEGDGAREWLENWLASQGYAEAGSEKFPGVWVIRHTHEK